MCFRKTLIFIYPAFFYFIALLAPISDKDYFIVPLVAMFFLYFLNFLILKERFYIAELYARRDMVGNRMGRGFFVFFLLLLFLLNNMLVYYTGIDVYTSFDNIIAGKSNYNEYQRFFRDNQRYEFELIKVYYNLLLALLKVSAFFGVFLAIFSSGGRIRYLFLVSPLLIYAMTRGTSVEFFELFMYSSVLFIIKYNGLTPSDRKKLIASAGVITILVVFLFLYQIQSRYSFGYKPSGCVYSFCYDDQGAASFFDSIMFSLTPYFLGGISNIYIFFEGADYRVLFPINSTLFSTDLAFYCKTSEFLCGPWKPNLLSLTENLGSLVVIFIYLLIPFLIRRILISIKGGFSKTLVLYFYIYFLFSTFSGEGVISSFSNIFIILFLVLYWVKCRFSLTLRSFV